MALGIALGGAVCAALLIADREPAAPIHRHAGSGSGPQPAQFPPAWQQGRAPASPPDGGLWDERLIESVVDELSQTDPGLAASYAAAVTKGGERQWLMGKVAEAWARSDPVAAIGWLQEQPDDETKLGLVDRVVAGLTDSDPEAAVHLAQAFAPTDLALAGGPARRWAALDPPAAMRWLESLPPCAGRAEILSGMIDSIGESVSPLEAASYVGLLPSGPMREQAIDNVIASWVRTDAWMASQWAEEFPEGAERRNALRQTAYQWSFHDPNGAAQWLASLSPGWDRDDAVRVFGEATGAN